MELVDGRHGQFANDRLLRRVRVPLGLFAAGVHVKDADAGAVADGKAGAVRGEGDRAE